MMNFLRSWSGAATILTMAVPKLFPGPIFDTRTRPFRMADRAILLHRLATQDYLVGLRWYAERSGWSAQKFRAAVGQTLARIARTPEQGATYRERFQWMRLRKFPFIIYYEV